MIFFMVALSLYWKLGLSIKEVRFPKVVSSIFVQLLLKTSVVSFGSFLKTFFSSGVMLSLFIHHKLVEKCLIAFQKKFYLFLLLLFLAYLITLYICFSFLQVQKFSLECHLKHRFLDLDLFMIVLLNFFVINGAWLVQIFRLFCDACFSEDLS